MRTILISVAFAGWLLALQGICSAQTTTEKPEQVGVCDLAREPERFNGKMISVRAPVSIRFEHFALSVANCGSERSDDIWLEYGRGPKRQPTTWCCGDMVPRDTLVLVQDGDFRNFHRLLTAERRAKGCYAGQCYVYDVTATITGRLDAVQAEIGPYGARICKGFGHFGVYCTRLVIHNVSKVVAERTTELKRMN